MAGHENLAAALAGFQAELPKLRKDETAKVRGEGKDGQPVNYQYGYADLAQVVEAVMPVLGKHGLSFTATPTMYEGGVFVLLYALTHESGEKIQGIWPLPNPVQTKPQNLGSAITYARRYALMAVTGTFPDKEDDDGAKAGEVPAVYRAEPASQPRQRQQRQRLGRDRTDADVVDKLGQGQTRKEYSDAEVLGQHGKLEALELDKAVKLYDWMAGGGRSLHQRGVNHPDKGFSYTATEVLAIRLGDQATAPGSDIATLDQLRGIAEDRGLLKAQVSDTETLDEVLASVRAIRNAEALDTPNADTLRRTAANSWAGADEASSGLGD